MLESGLLGLEPPTDKASLMSGVKSVSRHEETSENCGSFARQGNQIARQNVAIHVSKIICCANIINLPSGWFYQDHRWSLINKPVVLIKQICGPTKTKVHILRLSII